MVTEMNLHCAWAAGFIDGEGSITLIRTAAGKVVPVIMAYNTDSRPLYKLQMLFGGSVSRHESRKEGWAATYSWRLSHRRVGDALRAMTPYLVVKDGQAAVVVTYIDLMLHSHNQTITEEEANVRLSFVDAVQRLNKRGPKNVSA